MKDKRAVIQSLIILSGIIILILSGCGEKGPPLAPEIKGQKIAAPVELKIIPGNKEIIFSWNHKVDNEIAVVKPKYFEIFMAKKTLEACIGCPFEFKTIGVATAPSMEFIIKIEKGFKYYFRIQAKGEGTMRSEYSKSVKFESK
jgi:predicted small lipoprotein YifL